MTDAQENKLSMGLVVQRVVNDNNSIWSGLPAFVRAFSDFEGIITDIHTNRVLQEKDTKGVTLDKQDAEDVLIEKTVEVSSGVYAYAVEINDNTLKENVNYSPSFLSNVRDTILRDICQLIHDEANAVISNLADFSILPADLTDLQNKINDYNDAIPEPREAITDRSLATSELKILFERFDIVLNDRMDKLVNMFKKDYPKFHRQYDNARIIVDLGIRHREPEKPKIPPVILITDQSTLKKVKISIKGVLGDEITIKWGDDDIVDVVFDESLQYFEHDYVTEDNYTITISGKTESMIEFFVKKSNIINAKFDNSFTTLDTLDFNDNGLTEIVIPETMVSLRIVDLAKNDIDEPNVNGVLIVIDLFGTSTTDGQIVLNQGTNASPTGDGIVAKDNLISRGWTVIVN